jgi:hypothetical protein
MQDTFCKLWRIALCPLVFSFSLFISKSDVYPYKMSFLSAKSFLKKKRGGRGSEKKYIANFHRK